MYEPLASFTLIGERSTIRLIKYTYDKYLINLMVVPFFLRGKIALAHTRDIFNLSGLDFD